MVRVNLIEPRRLSDQHLIAEYNEILMLLSYIKKYNSCENLPKNYCLGKGHMRFFKNKVLYLKNRFETLKKEMILRDFKPNKEFSIKNIPKELLKNWKPETKDFEIIKSRIISKIKLKPGFYRYYKNNKNLKFFINLVKD